MLVVNEKNGDVNCCKTLYLDTLSQKGKKY